jgi:DNA helicase IV
MNSRRDEIAHEQVYFDTAAVHRQRHHDALGQAPGAAAHPRAAAQVKAFVQRQHEPGDPQAVAFGRIDSDDGESLYIGRGLIRGDHSQILVINWQVPAAERYYTASYEDPLGLIRRRTYDCDGNTIVDLTDVLYAEGVETADEFLLRELGRKRTGSMRDIVATIQAAQFDVIRHTPDQLLVIEGGPGTGKTAIALHRVSWLLSRHPNIGSAGALVVGPHPTFIQYIRDVLPGLGDDDVVLRDLRQLAPSVQPGRTETEPVVRLKGDARMADVLGRAIDARIGEPEAVERISLDGRFVSVPGADIAGQLAVSRALALPYAERRTAFRDRLVALVSARAGTQPVPPGAIANLLDRLWPQQTSPAFLHDLYGSRRRLALASAGVLSEAESNRLYRRGADRLSEELWSEADLPLLDELEQLINGTPTQYSHIVVDEAQDLSPMQLRSISRRSSTGSLTLVGDLAQSTGPWARDSWDEVTVHLPQNYPVLSVTLRYGYRVPQRAFEFAAQLLPVAAPGVDPPVAVREAGVGPSVHSVAVGERAGRAVAVAVAHASENRFVGIICPSRCRREVESALAANGVTWSSAERGELGGAINLVSPAEAKGLEFDAVVVVEPEHIVAEYARGLRMLYIALTRTTGYLDIVCVGEPLPLTALSPVDAMPTATSRFDDDDVASLAAQMAVQIRNAAPKQRWGDVLDEARQLLGD